MHTALVLIVLFIVAAIFAFSRIKAVKVAAKNAAALVESATKAAAQAEVKGANDAVKAAAVKAADKL
jgi:hypothetical protein